MKYNILDLFSGMGGFALGFKEIKQFEIKLANDIWIPAKETYTFNNPEIPFILKDIKEITENDIRKYFAGESVDIIIGGPPCQGFSMCGARNIHDERNILFQEYARIVKITKPLVFVMENVKGLLSMKDPNNKLVIDIIKEKFLELGYNLNIKILNAKYFNVPQSRERVIIVGVRQDLENTYKFPEEKGKEILTVKDAFKGLDNLKELENNEKPTHKKDVIERMSYVPQGGNWQDIPEKYRVGGIHSNSYRRLSMFEPSITIKHAYKSMIIHPIENRCLTIREVCRLQSFPDTYVCKNTKTSQYQQLANAVPPQLAKALAESVFNFLEEKKKITFIDLFAGLGGFRIGFEKNGCKCVFSSEIDKHAIESYKNNFGEIPSGDITKIFSKDIPDFDILCAGFPCQPFSIAGYRKGFNDSRGTLFFEIARILSEKKPKAFLLENVKGIINHDHGNTLKTIEKILDSLGYKYSYKILNAKDYGVPQNRERWYCVGFRKDLNIEFDQKLNFNNLKQVFFKFPPKKELDIKLETILNIDVKNRNISETAEKNIKIHLKKFLENKEKNNFLTIAYEIRPSKCSFRKDGISPCFTAKMGTGGNNVPVIVEYNRRFTVRECLDLMGYPKSYKLKENNQQSYKQIGNSVVVPIVVELAKEIVKSLNQISNK